MPQQATDIQQVLVRPGYLYLPSRNFLEISWCGYTVTPVTISYCENLGRI